jgi:DNA-binding transcriptional ArsR family regulator
MTVRILHGSMQNVHTAPTLLPLLRSPVVGELLAWLFLHPDDSYSLTDLAHRLGVSHSTISRESSRLTESGLVHEVRHGNLRLLRANTDNRLATPLTELLALTYGPIAVLGELFATIAGVDDAYIYGSWAARYEGEPGPPPHDVDVLVIGEADDDDLYDAARRAEHRLGREVNVHRVSAEAWRHGDTDAFLSSVRTRPLVPLR